MRGKAHWSSFSIGWDVGGWNCDKNGKSRDALVILDAEQKIVGKPWRGNLRLAINEATDSADWIGRLFALCAAVAPTQPKVTLAIDTPLGFSEGFVRLIMQRQSAKAEAYEQGRQLGKIEGNSQHLEEIIALKSEFNTKLAAEVDGAVTESRKRLTAEYELQTKLFTVQISPFVRISENKGLFSSESEVETGYQYQLLVNGIPAFQPHSIVERSEVRKEVNEENVRELVAIATDFASTAIETYLGAGGGKFAKLASVIVKKLPKK